MTAIHTHKRRDYSAIAQSLQATGSHAQRMQKVVDALWDALNQQGVSWVGFYLATGDPAAPLILGPCRNKPACSPIGLHGVCGQSLLSRQVRIVRDVKELGDQYIACDPRDRSEIVIPLINSSQECWAVLDVDSWEVGSFDDLDAAGLQKVLQAAGL